MKKEIAKLLGKHISLKEQEIETLIEIPPDAELGDFAFPCFALSSKLKKSPVEIAKELEIKSSKLPKNIEKIEAKGPYLNFFVNKLTLMDGTLKKILKEREKFGSLNLGKGKKALVEHTSINPNASPHVGRARNALIGDFIVKILKFQGYNVKTHYFVNDIGKQVALLLLGAENKKNIQFNDLLNLYIQINKKIEETPELERKVFNLLNKLENNDKKTRERFRKIVDICVKGQIKILSELGIHYDKFDYESDYLFSKKTDEILKSLEKTGKLFVDEEKRKVLNQKEFKLAMKAPYLVLTRADGTSLYPLRDLAYTIDKHVKGENIIVLGEDQKLYFQQLTAALKLLKKESPRVIHYSFVLLTQGKMSTRKGNVVLLEDFMKETLDKAKKEIKKRHETIKEENAKKIAYSAIKYGILKVSSEKNVVFDLEQALNFEGNTGPYLLYSYARANSILKKAGKTSIKKIKSSNLKANLMLQEFSLVKKLSEFPEIVSIAYKNLTPSDIANYSFQLSQLFNEFYHSCPVLHSENENFRLNIVKSFMFVLKNSLALLGIGVIEKM